MNISTVKTWVNSNMLVHRILPLLIGISERCVVIITMPRGASACRGLQPNEAQTCGRIADGYALFNPGLGSVRHLANHVLGGVARLIVDDWQRLYHQPIYLLETMCGIAGTSVAGSVLTDSDAIRVINFPRMRGDAQFSFSGSILKSLAIKR